MAVQASSIVQMRQEPRWLQGWVSELDVPREGFGRTGSGPMEKEPRVLPKPYEYKWGITRSIGKLHDEHSWLGPAIFTAAGIWFVIQIIVAWVFSPSYSLVSNSISDLGETSCGGAYGNGICSPRSWVMNAFGFGLLGVVMVLGSALLYHEFTQRDPRQRRTAMIAFSLLAVAGLGTILVGCFPENGDATAHEVAAGIAIGIGNVAIFVLGAVLQRLPESMRRSMLTFSAVSLAALVCYAFHKYFGINQIMERVAAYPMSIWLITFGLYIWRFRPKKDDLAAAGLH
jgi:hypothetical membrane protein